MVAWQHLHSEIGRRVRGPSLERGTSTRPIVEAAECNDRTPKLTASTEAICLHDFAIRSQDAIDGCEDLWIIKKVLSRSGDLLEGAHEFAGRPRIPTHRRMNHMRRPSSGHVQHTRLRRVTCCQQTC